MSEASRSSVYVALRVRPQLPKEQGEARCIHVDRKDPGTVCIDRVGDTLQFQYVHLNVFYPPGSAACFSPPPNPRFDAAYDSNATQEDIYKKEVLHLLPGTFEGVNITIFAYGMTSAGKTYTMEGKKNNPGSCRKILSSRCFFLSL